MTYQAAPDRYERTEYRRCGRSGLKLPPVGLGFWYMFREDRAYDESRSLMLHAFDKGITYFDFGNNYGHPYGSAERGAGQVLKRDLRRYRDEIVLSTKAGYDMWPGPYGDGGSRKYLLASLDQSLRRLKTDYVDIFYSHRFDADTPLEETMGALHSAVQSGKALYVGISTYGVEQTIEAARILAELGTPLVVHQASYSMLNRWVEKELLGTLDDLGVGCVGFSPLAQGLLSEKYIPGVPVGSRAAEGHSLSKEMVSPEVVEKLRHLSVIARDRGQSLAQLAIAWALRNDRISCALLGATSRAQLDENLLALERTEFTEREMDEIDKYATESGINLWAPRAS